MHLYEIPLLFVLIGLVLYIVLGGADFGVGLWELLAGRDERIRSHAHASMAPVWEANHVWLIFVLTVTWTAYPTFFGSVFSTLAVPLFLAGLGIVLRGAAYAMRAGARAGRESRALDLAFSLSCVLTPFALGTVVGAIAARRVPVGNAAGHLFSSWLNPTAVLIGVVAVLLCGYTAAVFLAADAARRSDADLASAFRTRALVSGAVAGAAAVAGLVVLHVDDSVLAGPLLSGSGLPALVVSIVAGVTTLGLVAVRRYEPARYTAAVAVAAVVAGWALAQQPILLPGLTVAQAAAPHDTLVAVIVAVIGGGLILFPSLALLFRLTLGGSLGAHPAESPVTASPTRVLAAARAGLAARGAAGCLIVGAILLVFGDDWWMQAVGVIGLIAFVVLGVAAVGPGELARVD